MHHKIIDRIKMKTNRELHTIIRTITVDFAMSGNNALCNMMTFVQYLQKCSQQISARIVKQVSCRLQITWFKEYGSITETISQSRATFRNGGGSIGKSECPNVVGV
uniref:(northern house mosquito) hypothetical protein n=1 Tax=Culex pipiens TaxID=7175 RepID=A0A8D8CFN0_CULPI